jgi:hypothetical protein
MVYFVRVYCIIYNIFSWNVRNSFTSPFEQYYHNSITVRNLQENYIFSVSSSKCHSYVGFMYIVTISCVADVSEKTAATRSRYSVDTMKHPLSCPFTHPCAHYAQYLPIFADVDGATCDKTGHIGLIYISVYCFSWFKRDINFVSSSR